jgi:hypothetical protein
MFRLAYTGDSVAFNIDDERKCRLWTIGFSPKISSGSRPKDDREAPTKLSHPASPGTGAGTAGLVKSQRFLRRFDNLSTGSDR